MEPYKLLTILNALHTFPNLYILGAGVSAGIAKTTAQSIQGTKDIWISGKSFPGNFQNNFRYKRFYGDLGYSTDINDGLLLSLPLPYGLNWLFLNELYPNFIPSHIIQYDIFNFFPGKSCFVSFNLDPLSRLCIKNHILFEPHGSLSNSFKFFAPSDIREFAEYNIPINNELIIIEHENERILRKPVYEYLIKQWKYFKYIFIIGYSFSKHDSGIDDEYSLLYFSELLKYYKTPIIILDLNPCNILKLLLAYNVKNNTLCCKVNWKIFTESIYYHFVYNCKLNRTAFLDILNCISQ